MFPAPVGPVNSLRRLRIHWQEGGRGSTERSRPRGWRKSISLPLQLLPHSGFLIRGGRSAGSGASSLAIDEEAKALLDGEFSRYFVPLALRLSA